MVLSTKEDGILIKVLRQLLEEFLDKDWSCSALDWTDFCGRLMLQGLQTGSPAAAENVRSAQETCKCLCKWRPLWAQTVTDGIAYELLRRLFHIGNFCFWVPFFKQLLLKNYAVDFVEICNVCLRKVIIKAAKRIFNSDKICHSYCDFYLASLFLEHTVYLPATCYWQSLRWKIRDRGMVQLGLGFSDSRGPLP